MSQHTPLKGLDQDCTCAETNARLIARMLAALEELLQIIEARGGSGPAIDEARTLRKEIEG